MPNDKSVECIADVKAVLGEGPVWVAREGALYWVDIKGRRIFRHIPGGETASWATPVRVGSLAPRAEGGFIGGTDRGLAWIEPEHGRYEVFSQPEPDRPTNRFNDGKLDREGRFWAGTMDDEERSDSGALYRLDSKLQPVRVDDGYRVTNGPAFSPDGRIMYHNDSARQTVFAFDLNDGGGAYNKRVFAQFGEGDGYPDGMAVDSDGCLWIAFWDGWCLRRLSPAGDCVETLKVPVQRPTSCVFGGANLDCLFISSARIGLDENAIAMQPYAGGLFMTGVGTRGIADTLFAG